MVEDMLRNCGIDKGELTRVAVAAGPGSFTGVRIGCAAAKGLSWALGIPCRPVSTLEAMAYSYAYDIAESRERRAEIISCEMDARRGQVYNALFEYSAEGLTRLTPDRAIALDELNLELSANCSLFTVHRSLSDAWGVILAAQNAPDAEPNPVYLRMPQAERELLKSRDKKAERGEN
jgi:tRNA threonylcarbamoyladenosine biosynthesis protein TsaB